MKPPPRVLVLAYSQSGQVRRAVEAFVAPLTASGADVVVRELVPVTPFPFPWKVADFFGAMPETVLNRPAPIARVDAPPGEWDLVVVAGQIWFLSPSQPIAALLAGPDRALVKGRRVLTLVTCRNMWLRGWRQLVGLVSAAGGTVTDRIIVTHSGVVLASYFNTLFWVLTGRRDAVKPLGKAEIAEASFQRVGALARRVAERLPTARPGEALLGDEETATLSYPHAFGEQIGGALYPPLSRAVAAISAPGSALRAVCSWILLFIVLSLIFGLVVPCFATWWVAGGALRRWLDGLARMPTTAAAEAR